MAVCIFLKERIAKNYRLWSELCRASGVQLNLVTKFCLCNPELIHFFCTSEDLHPAAISDSNMEDFARLSPEDARRLAKCVIKTRVSDIENIPSLPDFARPDRLWVSDEEQLQAVARLPQEVRPELVLIAETGDLKDGILLEDIPRIAEKWHSLPIIGVSVNFSCLSGILPDIETVKKLSSLAAFIQHLRGLPRPFLSVGGTVVYGLLSSGALKGLVQEVRCGEGIFFGYDSSGGQPLPGFERDTIILEGEVVELAEKDSAIQQGRTAGFSAVGSAADSAEGDAFRGVRRRAVLDFGVLVARAEDLRPLDAGVSLRGQTFDFTVADVTNCRKLYETGGTVAFATNYASASFALMNRYVRRRIEEEDTYFGKKTSC